MTEICLYIFLSILLFIIVVNIKNFPPKFLIAISIYTAGNSLLGFILKSQENNLIISQEEGSIPALDNLFNSIIDCTIRLRVSMLIVSILALLALIMKVSSKNNDDKSRQKKDDKSRQKKEV